MKKRSCFVTCLVILAVIVLFPVIIAFGWIAGLLWLIFFRKKMKDTPDKQKGYTVGISAASALSLFIFICATATPPSPASLTLSSPIYRSESNTFSFKIIDSMRVEKENLDAISDHGLHDAIIICDNGEKDGSFDGTIIDGYATGNGIFYSTNSAGYSYELHATFVDGYIDGYSELLFENGNYVYGNYDMGLKNGTFTSYSDTLGEFEEDYESGKQIGDTRYIKINDSYIYTMADELLQSESNPANWSDTEIGIDGITDTTSDKYKTAISNWQDKISEYENSVFQTCADSVGMTREQAEEAYQRAVNGQNSSTTLSKEQTSQETKPQKSAQESNSENNTNFSDESNNFDTYDNAAQAEETTTIETSPVSEPEVLTPVGDMVWLSATGSKYHRINNCGRMNPNKARQVSLDDAISKGYEKCSKCY